MATADPTEELPGVHHPYWLPAFWVLFSAAVIAYWWFMLE
jgi:hypothetical protein